MITLVWLVLFPFNNPLLPEESFLGGRWGEGSPLDNPLHFGLQVNSVDCGGPPKVDLGVVSWGNSDGPQETHLAVKGGGRSCS